MQFSEAYQYLNQSERRKEILLEMSQPATAHQLSILTKMDRDACSYLIWELVTYELLTCLNSDARRSRVYWLTTLGERCQRKLRTKHGLPQVEYDIPRTDWNIYGWVCFNHRESVLKAISKPMQAVEIAKAAKFRASSLRLSTNNARDVLYLFAEKGIVRKVLQGKKRQPRYELTELGRQLQLLLLKAGVARCK